MNDAHPQLDAFLRRQGSVAWVLRHRPPERDLDDPLRRELNDSEKIRAAALPPGRRRIEWSEARRLEREVRAALPAEARATLSVSHTEGIVLVIGVVWGPVRGDGPLPGLGVDVELLDRKVDRRVLERVATPDELALSLPRDSQDLWVVKEACFKANPGSEGTIMTQYRVIAFDSGTGEGAAEGPGGPTSFCVGDFGPRWRIAIAVVQRAKIV